MARTSAVDTSRTYCGVSLRGGLYEGHGRLYFSHWSLCRGSCCLFGSPYHDQSVLVNFEQACISAPPFQPSCHSACCSVFLAQTSNMRLPVVRVLLDTIILQYFLQIWTANSLTNCVCSRELHIDGATYGTPQNGFITHDRAAVSSDRLVMFIVFPSFSRSYAQRGSCHRRAARSLQDRKKDSTIHRRRIQPRYSKLRVLSSHTRSVSRPNSTYTVLC
jgi:hypothetical protein